MTGVIHNRAGFATITALALLAIVGMTLGLMTINFADDGQRTAKEQADAQVRQLMFAAQKAKGAEKIGLPRMLVNQGAEMKIDAKTIAVRFRSEIRRVERGG